MTFADIAQSVGRDVFLTDTDGWKSMLFRAVVQPLRYKNKMYLDGTFTKIGKNTGGYYLYIGPPDHDVAGLAASARLVDADGKRYSIDRGEKVWFGNEIFYIWAILREANEVTG